MRGRFALALVGMAGAAILVGRMQAGTRLQKAATSGGAVQGAGSGGVAGGIGPDVIVGALNGIQTWGTTDGITGYSIGTTSCNIGDVDLKWFATTNEHPVIGQNIYRLENGRFEQLGQSWLKHAFTTINNNWCGMGCNGHLGTMLGIGCSDPYGASLNGDQDGFPCGEGVCSGGLGPRSEVNATTGFYLWPYGSAGMAGDPPYKRCQVHVDDVAPTLHPDALFYGEGQYVTADDAAVANHHNNASYRRITIGGAFNGGYLMALTGPTTRELPAIYAWQDNDPEVIIVQVEDDGNPGDDLDGRFHLGFRATDNGDGT